MLITRARKATDAASRKFAEGEMREGAFGVAPSSEKPAVSSDHLVEALAAFAEQSLFFPRLKKQGIRKIKSFSATVGGTRVAVEMV